MSKKSIPSLQVSDIDRIIEMAWEDRTTFTDIKNQYGIYEKDVIAIMKKNLKRSSFLMWRQRECVAAKQKSYPCQIDLNLQSKKLKLK